MRRIPVVATIRDAYLFAATHLGGVIGLLIAYLGTLGLSRAFDSDISISVTYALLALGIATGVGTGAGFFPAFVASRLPPVEALRYEN